MWKLIPGTEDLNVISWKHQEDGAGIDCVNGTYCLVYKGDILSDWDSLVEAKSAWEQYKEKRNVRRNA